MLICRHLQFSLLSGVSSKKISKNHILKKAICQQYSVLIFFIYLTWSYCCLMNIWCIFGEREYLETYWTKRFTVIHKMVSNFRSSILLLYLSFEACMQGCKCRLLTSFKHGLLSQKSSIIYHWPRKIVYLVPIVKLPYPSSSENLPLICYYVRWPSLFI